MILVPWYLLTKEDMVKAKGNVGSGEATERITDNLSAPCSARYVRFAETALWLIMLALIGAMLVWAL